MISQGQVAQRTVVAAHRRRGQFLPRKRGGKQAGGLCRSGFAGLAHRTEHGNVGPFEIVAQFLAAPQQRLAIGRHARQHGLYEIAAQSLFGGLNRLLFG